MGQDGYLLFAFDHYACSRKAAPTHCSRRDVLEIRRSGSPTKVKAVSLFGDT